MPQINKENFVKTYIPKDHEQDIYQKWESSGAFNPDNLDLEENTPSYSIVMPPPNVTGTLHMGHAGMLAYEDILTRFHRMKGFRTLWLPGTDHAAIATQTKVEKIIKEEGLTRHSLGRKKFLQRVEQFAQKSHDTIEDQVKKMGSSCDWSREAFTLDKTRNKAVNSVFKLMYEDGLIYRGERVVNWCPRCHSTLADDEVEHENKKAKLYTFKYSKDFPISIATTRPETKIGDTAIAVNPKDERYNKYVGKTFKVNFIGVDLKIKVIADREIDMDFGTGALGVTPAHSMVDWQMAENNNLEVIKVVNEDGNIKNGFGEFSKLTALDARALIVQRIKESNLLEKEEEIENALSLCYRCDTSIEPLLSLQWFIDVNKKTKRLGDKSIKEICIDAVENGVFGKEKINIIPERFEKNYFHWMNDLRDWCISRQIWYGHRVPVWYKNDETFVGIDGPKEDGWKQDEDTLDTWFSSGMWTFSTLANNPEQIKIEDGKIVIDNKDFENFHPTAVLETGYDILFFWVARMIIMTTYAINDIPFQDVYLHGLVLDEHGKKMSKSKENVINPLDMIDKYGTDATRLSLITGSTPGKDLKLSEKKIEGLRNMVNKLWNISRYIIETIKIDDSPIKRESLTTADKAILQSARKLIIETTEDISYYRFSKATESLREFSWNELADWYLETTKFDNSSEKAKNLTVILRDLLKIWHPFIPFVTETIWEKFNNTLLITEKWPGTKIYDNVLNESDKKDLMLFDKTKEIITSIRNIRAEYKVGLDKKIDVIIYANELVKELSSQETLIKNLRTGIDNLSILETGEKIDDAIYKSLGKIELFIPLKNLVDTKKEKERLSKELKEAENYLISIENKLQNKAFVKNAPSEVIQKEHTRATLTKNKIEKIKEFLIKLNQN